MYKILIAEDHAIVRLGIILIVKELYPGTVVTEADNFDLALSFLEKEDFDLLILDINLPGGDYVHMIEAVKMRDDNISILIFSNYDEELYALQFLKSGADGYLQKDAQPDEISTALDKLLKKDKYISDIVQKQLLNTITGRKDKTDTESLSNREWEIMRLLIKGSSPSEIKRILNIQLSTISTYKARIFEKMKVSNVLELADKVKFLKKNNIPHS